MTTNNVINEINNVTFKDVLAISSKNSIKPKAISKAKLELFESTFISKYQVEANCSILRKPGLMTFTAGIPVNDFVEAIGGKWDFESPLNNNLTEAFSILHSILANTGGAPSAIWYYYNEKPQIAVSWEVCKPIIITDRYMTYLQLLAEFDSMLKNFGVPNFSILDVKIKTVEANGDIVPIDVEDFFYEPVFK